MFRAPSHLDVVAETCVGYGTQHLADLASFDQVPNLHAEREVAGPDGLHKEEVLLAGGFDEDLCLGCVDGECFFAEDVFAGR
jgi:hypothetical protein